MGGGGGTSNTNFVAHSKLITVLKQGSDILEEAFYSVTSSPARTLSRVLKRSAMPRTSSDLTQNNGE